jgi:voltage-gated potassium channel
VESHPQPQQDWEQDLRELGYRLGAAALFLTSVLLVGTVGFRVVDPNASWLDALYMTTITLTTVGYGEVVDLSANPGGRIFTILLILTGMGGVLYFISTATAFVIEMQLGHVFWRRRMERKSAHLSNHIIVCGSGSTAIYTAAEIRAVKRPLVMICDDPEWLEVARAELDGVPILSGDPTSEEVLEKAGLDRARGVVACTRSDKDNLLITVLVRQINPLVRIVARVTDIHGASRVEKAGADAVVAPTLIGGLRMASELIRPTVVSFLDEMLRDKDLNLRIDEVRIPSSSPFVGKTVDDLGLRVSSNAMLLACRLGESWRYNPPEELTITPDMVLILMGSPEDIRAVCETVEGDVVVLPSPTPA